MSASGTEPVLQDLRTTVALQRRAPFREGRLRLGLRTALVAVQVVFFNLVGWMGATLTLLPLAIRGAPLGRRGRVDAPRVVHLLEPSQSREALPD